MKDNAKDAAVKTLNVGVLGAGSRSKQVVKLLCGLDKSVRIKAIYDPASDRVGELKALSGQSEAEERSTYQSVVEDPEISLVMVMSPNSEHKEHVIAAFRAGKDVFAEKPLATSIADCQAIYEAHRASGRIFATGFVLRYAPLYLKVKELLDSGVYGKILNINADENIATYHGAFIMRNWRRFSKFAGSHILEKCCHDLDLINWFAQSLPARVASFGGSDFFVPENAGIREKIKRQDGDDSVFGGWKDNQGAECPFTSEKDIVDNQVSIFELRNKIRVMFQCTLSNAIPERRMFFTCSEGNIVAELYSGIVKAKRIGKNEKEQIFDYSDGGLHGYGDEPIMKALLESARNRTPPKCSGSEGLESAVVAIAADEARKSGRVVDLEPVWKSLER